MNPPLSRHWNPRTLFLFNNGAQEFLFSLIFTASAIYQITEAHLDPLQLVIVGTTLEATIFVFEIPTGIVADVVSRRLSVIIGAALMGVSFVLLGIFPQFGMILFVQFLLGVGYTFTSGSTSAWMVDEVGEEAAGPIFVRSAQIASLTSNAGIIGAILLGGLALRLPIIAGGVGFMALAGLLTAFMGETGFTPAPREQRSLFQQMGHTFAEGARSVRGRPMLIALLAITFIAGGASEGLDRLFTIHLINDIGLPQVWNLQPIHWIGAFDLARGFVIAGVAHAAERWLDTRRGRTLAIVLMGMTALRIAMNSLYALATSLPLGLLAAGLASVARNLGEPLTQIWLNQQIESRTRATVLSMNGQADAIGQVAVGPVFGLIGTLRSVRAALLASAMALLPTLPLYARALRKANDSERISGEPEA